MKKNIRDISDYFYCTGCLWEETCENEILSVNGSSYRIAPSGFCDDYSPADDSDAEAYYHRDLAERADIYRSFLEEYQ